MLSYLKEIQDNFINNIELVNKLMSFDEVVLDFSIQSISSLHEKLKKHHQLDNPQLSAEKTLNALKNIRENKTMKRNYTIIFNQCIVLLVSYFGSALSEVFKNTINNKMKTGLTDKLSKEEIKLSLSELEEMNFELYDYIGQIIINKNDISFQDMKSISRAFKNYLDCDIKKGKVVNNIILAQACRHVIVHSGNVIDDRLIKQVKSAMPRDVKPALSVGEEVQFTPEEITIVSESMKTYLANIVQQLSEQKIPE